MKKALASKTGQVKFLQKGEPGKPGDKGARLRMRDWLTGQSHLRGSAGEEWYDVALYKNLLYLCVKSHTSSTANNPQTSVANNLGYWEKAQDWAFMATRLLLAERIKAEDIDADNLVAKNVDVEGKITANAAFIKTHNFRAHEGYFFLNPNFGSDFINGRPNRISTAVYMLPDAVQYAGMKISLTIYKDLASTYGSISVVTRNAFNETEIVGSEMKYCNRASISGAGRYEFISLGILWILANGNGASFSYADLGNYTYEDPVS